MKINHDIYQKIEAAIQKVIDVSGGPKALQSMYQSKTETCLVWDVFWATPGSNATACDLYAMGCNDNHVETMLTQICKQHGLIPEQDTTISQLLKHALVPWGNTNEPQAT